VKFSRLSGQEDRQYSISLLFNANKVYDRQVIEGIGHYLQSTKVDWDVYLEEDCLARLNNLDNWEVDGIIADFDDPDMQAALTDLDIPVIGVGGSYQNADDYPDVPYVATDNEAVVNCAYQHLKQKGLQRFAFYGFPPDTEHRWALERERAIVALCEKDGFSCSVYRGFKTQPDTWHYSMNRLADWIESLPLPVGVIAVTDARARHLLQACDKTNRLVPDQVSIVGIDDDDIARNLSRVSLSSVSQGCFDMGFHAAKLLHRQLNRQKAEKPSDQKAKIKSAPRVLVPPIGIIQRQSTDFKALQDPYVIQAMHYVRQHACRGIKVEQVIDYVGISRSNLEQRFVQECGHSIHTEIHNEKLNRACKMLAETDTELAEIANSCGYPSIQYLYAVFKKHFGQTPKQYKSDLLQKDLA
jgi:LacI family transcriptional regulator